MPKANQQEDIMSVHSSFYRVGRKSATKKSTPAVVKAQGRKAVNKARKAAARKALAEQLGASLADIAAAQHCRFHGKALPKALAHLAQANI
jgi:hypothetical protein